MSTSLFRNFRKRDRAALRKQERRRRFQVESLEGRQMLSTFTVNSLGDTGAGSNGSGDLLYCITQSNNTSVSSQNPYNAITFNFSALTGGTSGQQVTINLTSPLPAITQTVHILGELPGGEPGVVLNGAGAGSSTAALQLTSTAPSSEVQGLVVDSFAGGGILVDGATDQITGDFIGVNGAGTAAAGDGYFGVRLTGNAIGAIVEGDTISASYFGVEIGGTRGAIVTADNIGTDATGSFALGNTFGVYIAGGATGNQIGTSDVISGNAVDGVLISGTGTTGNVVAGDLIGTDKSGAVALGNGSIGVRIDSGASDNTIGGTGPGTADTISGNAVYGVYMQDAGTSGNVVEGDFIGTNFNGTTATGTNNQPLGNVDGVDIASGASGNIIGGTTVAARDIISGNALDGVQLSASGTGNVVEGDYIGTNAGGNAPVPNSRAGVTIQGGANNNLIGGTATGSGDVISGNGNYGVWIAGSSNTLVEGDLIGTNAGGTAAVGNVLAGVWISGGSRYSTIGGTTAAARDTISGNTQWGVYITDSGTTGNVVEGDYVGTDVSGNNPLPNGYNGVDLVSGTTSNTVGGTTAGALNIISGNANNGVVIAFNGASQNTVEGNWIGLNASGDVLPNQVDGVIVQGGATNNTIGGAAPNVISGNLQQGVLITDPGTSGNVVAGDFIGTDTTGAYGTDHNGAFVGNRGHGVLITNGATSNTVGGTTTAARDVISNNSYNGVAFSGSTTSNNVVEGDYIGVNANGTAALGNQANGVFFSSAPNNTIGGTTAGAGDVISGNWAQGVWITSGASGEVVEGDYIGTDYAGKAAVANQVDGVLVNAGSTNNAIGGTAPGAGNVISGNGNTGVVFSDSGTTGNGVYGNLIGTDVTGSNRLANHYGVQLLYGASNNTVGTVGGRNVISGNGWDGVQLIASGTTGNTVQDNDIGTNAAGNAALANTGSGVALAGGASSNYIDDNVISGNLGDGVYVSDSGTNSNWISGDYIGTDATGSFAVPNSLNGVIFQAGASSNLVVFSIISGNLQDGVLIQGSGTNSDYLEYNGIGVNAAGNAVVHPSGRLYSNDDGVHITNGASYSYVAANTISGDHNGVEIDNSATGNSIVSNSIGTVTFSLNGGTFGNVQYDVYLQGTSGNTIDYNTIANSYIGIYFLGSPNQDGGHNTFSNNSGGNEQSSS